MTSVAETRSRRSGMVTPLARFQDRLREMGFPESPRVIYRRNPLVDVVAQLRFPPILKIDSEPPAAFQDAIRNDYPQYADASPASPFPGNLSPQVMNLLQGLAPTRPSGSRHQFSADEQVWQVFLTRESLELKTTAYSRWEEFRGRLAKLIGAFETTYHPGGYNRVGLRYVDVIRRSSLSLGDVPWSDLLNPFVAGELGAAELGEAIDKASGQIHSRVDDRSFITLNTGIALAEPSQEKCFLIDCDFHTHNKVETKDALDLLDSFNRMSGRFFRWCIKPRLHDALEPQPITND